MQIPIEVGQPVVNITVQLAPGDSLGVDAKEAAARFLIPDLYVWFQTHPQTVME